MTATHGFSQPELSATYPWVWDALGHLPNVFLGDKALPLLLVEPGGLGIETVLQPLLKIKYCESAQKPCGSCKACIQIDKGIFPKVRVLEPVDGKITVDAVRELSEWLSQKSSQSLTVLMPQAEKLTVQAANAFLKTLEEPLQSTTYILTTSLPEALLPTIRSRLITFRAKLPAESLALEHLLKEGCAEQDAKKALQMTDGLILKAKTFLNDDKKLWLGFKAWLAGEPTYDKWLTEAADKNNLVKILDWWIREMHQEIAFANNYDAWVFLDKLISRFGLVKLGTALNGKLLLAALLIEWRRLKEA